MSESTQSIVGVVRGNPDKLVTRNTYNFQTRYVALLRPHMSETPRSKGHADSHRAGLDVLY
jgi:hypothetical protein